MGVINPGGSGGGGMLSGTAAARPAAGPGNTGQAYWATDTNEISFSDGAAWHILQQASGSFALNFNGNPLLRNPFGSASVGLANTGVVSLNPVSSDVRITQGSGSGGSVDVVTAGQGLKVAEGANAKQGIAVLAAGTVTVANTNVTANSRILLTSQADGGAPGFVRVSARVVGTSFTITSSSPTDTSTVAYEIFEPG